MSFAFIDLLAELLGSFSAGGVTREDVAQIIDKKVIQLRAQLEPDDIAGRLEIEELEAIAARLRQPADAIIAIKPKKPN